MARQQEAAAGPRDTEWAIAGLSAMGPFGSMKDKLALFGQFVGDWDIVEALYSLPVGGEAVRRGEIHFRWILEGRAVQDVWSMIDEKSREMVPAGTTIRFYDPKIDAWHSVWVSPVQNSVQPFVARKVGEEIVLEGKTKEGYAERWVFSEITTKSFRWHSEETHDDGKTWLITEQMKVRRKLTAS